MKIRRTYTREFKLKVLRECENGKGKTQFSREHGLHPFLISRWEKEFREDPGRAFSRNGNICKEDARIGELERVIGEFPIMGIRNPAVDRQSWESYQHYCNL